jgi:hypothetical protein
MLVFYNDRVLWVMIYSVMTSHVMSDPEHSCCPTQNHCHGWFRASGQPKTTLLTGSKFKFHSTLVVSNIRNHILIVLEMEKEQYCTPSCSAFMLSSRVLHHNVPFMDKKPPIGTSSAKYEQWTTIHSTVLQWIPRFLLTCWPPSWKQIPLLWKPRIIWRHFSGQSECSCSHPSARVL